MEMHRCVTDNGMTDAAELKNRIRSEVRRKRECLSVCQSEDISRGIVQRVMGTQEFKNADVLFFYWAVRNEADIKHLAKRAMAEGRTVLFPKVIDDSRMIFLRVRDFSELKPGYMGIFEPSGTENFIVPDGSLSLMLVPGVAFDKNGGRLGMGRGYYDRYINGFRTDCIMGICGEYQLVEKIPTETTDVSMDCVVTENNIYRNGD